MSESNASVAGARSLAGPPAREFFRVGAAGTTIHGDNAEAQRLFREFHAIQIRNVLEPEFLASILRLCATSHFGPGQTAPGFREVETPQRAGRVLNLALDRPALLRWLEDISGSGPLRSIEGRVTQTLNRPGDELLWHDDFLEKEGRRLAMVISLSTDPYEGGEFALRFKTGEMIFEHEYTELGSAMVFQVDRKLEHRVLPLRAGGPRRVFAGWAFGA